MRPHRIYISFVNEKGEGIERLVDLSSTMSSDEAAKRITKAMQAGLNAYSQWWKDKQRLNQGEFDL